MRNRFFAIARSQSDPQLSKKPSLTYVFSGTLWPMSDSLQRLTAALSDRYHIEREIGSGGMATVYLAQDIKHDRLVAVKVLRPELAAVIGAERFLAEINRVSTA